MPLVHQISCSLKWTATSIIRLFIIQLEWLVLKKHFVSVSLTVRCSSSKWRLALTVSELCDMCQLQRRPSQEPRRPHRNGPRCGDFSCLEPAPLAHFRALIGRDLLFSLHSFSLSLTQALLRVLPCLKSLSHAKLRTAGGRKTTSPASKYFLHHPARG